jgi:hypothetical protein
MLLRNPILQINIREKITTALIQSAHPRLAIAKNSGIRFDQCCPIFFSDLLGVDCPMTASGFLEGDWAFSAQPLS